MNTTEQHTASQQSPQTAPRATHTASLTHLAPQPLLGQGVNRETISWKRKVFHILGIGCVAVTHGMSVASLPLTLTILGIITFVFVGLDMLRFYVPALNKKVKRDFGPFMRDYELERLSGSSWFLFAGMIAIAAFPREAAALAFLFLALGDPIASWVGVRWGRTRLPGGKSVEGSLALLGVCAVTGFLFLLGVNQLNPIASISALSIGGLALFCLGAATTAAFAEWLPIKGVDDNFIVPVVAGLGITSLLFVI
jgi:dolichol kinase